MSIVKRSKKDRHLSPPQVSVITPAYNAEATLPRVFACLRAQRMTDWEHIVVIDGATDGTAALIRAVASRDPRIIVLEQAQGGASAARNTGLAVARGVWVVFLDADDTISPDHFHRMIARADRLPGTDVVCCGYLRCDSQGLVTERYPAPIFRGQAPFRSIVGTPPTVIHGVLARRSLIVEVGGFDTTLATNEDWDLWMRLARTTMGFAREPAHLAIYWNSEGSLTRDPVAMVRDVSTVLMRSSRADPRVPHPLPAFADGVQIESFDENILSCALWSAGSDIGRGGDGLSAIAALPDRLGQPWNRVGLAMTLLDGMMVGSGGRVADIARDWPHYSQRIDVLLSDIERRCDGGGLDYALGRDIEWEIARLARFRGSAMVGRTWSVRLTPATLFRDLTPPLLTEAVQFQPMWLPPHPQLMLHGIATRQLSAGEVRRQIAREIVRRGLRVLARAIEVKPALAPLIDRGMMALALALRLPRKLFERRRAALDPVVPGRVEEPEAGHSSTPGWDAFFRAEDPWNYGSAYEQLKYQRTLDLLPDRPIGRGIELACAEGMFTTMLAGRVDHLTATDISSVALERAGARCATAGARAIDFKVLDFFREPLGEGWDLIVSSEVLYYMSGTAELEAYAAKVETSLAPDGLFLHAHAFEVTDDPSHTGFDWEDPFGADTISRVFRATAGLKRVRAVTTDLYLIELYQRVATDVVEHVAVESLPLGTALEPDIAAMVVWNGAIATRPAVFAQERTARLPVLMYHHVADTGPEALAPWRVTPQMFEHQLRFLRRRGYRSVTIDEWEQADRNSASLRGRPVLITFDDAYVNFQENAWPILERNGFSAHMFVVTGKVGKTADWDADLAAPEPLMDWDGLLDLHRRGLSIGSHLDLHLASDRIPVRQLLDEAVRSRAILEDRLGVAVTTVAPPFGAMNIRVEQILREAGYTRIFDAAGTIAPVWGSRWKVPRIDVSGYDDISTFADKLGRGDEPPEPDDAP